MSDAGWQALSSIVASVCALIAALFAGKAWKQGQVNEQKIEQHEAASAQRSAEGKAAMPEARQ